MMTNSTPKIAFLALLLCLTACGEPLCGNGLIEETEACDDGNDTNGDGCDEGCVVTACGNGVLTGGELCDDGNVENSDDCLSNCTVNVCGDGFLNPAAERCDDGNITSGDGCQNDCQSLEQCGDGVVNDGEQCDDGNTSSGDGCQADCQDPRCGDGTLDTAELCDDGNTSSGDGCREDCQGVELCGDTLIDVGEQCDDGNNIDDDGCDADCSFADVIQVALNFGHSCALLDTGNIRCWGDGAGGVLGYGILNPRIGDDEPAGFLGDVNIGARVTQVALGLTYTCVLLETGNVRCWGIDSFGELGTGSGFQILGDDETPNEIADIDLGGTAVQLAAGNEHLCALLSTGDVKCWGRGDFGQLGYGNTNNIGDDETPASVGTVDVGGPVMQISAGNSKTCAVRTTGEVFCWGDGQQGLLGYGNNLVIGNNETPASAGPVDIGGSAVQISVSAAHTCALRDTGAVTCWGDNQAGFLGYGFVSELIGDNETPASMGTLDLGGEAIQIATGPFSTSCALLSTGSVRCWGQFGAISYGNTNTIGDDETPASVGDINIGGAVSFIAHGGVQSCAILESGALRCWGSNELGQLGYGNTEAIGDNEPPASAGDVPVVF